MRVVSVNVGLPRAIAAGDRQATSAIYKLPVAGPVRLDTLGFAGDAQADPKVHGGPAKAAYLYPSEHYAWWRTELPGVDLPWGAFGENVDIDGLHEAAVHVGDELRIGGALVRVTTPRFPCFKLGIRFGDPGMLRRFLLSERSGFYVAVVEPGDVGAGDPVTIVTQHPEAPRILDLVREKSSRARA